MDKLIKVILVALTLPLLASGAKTAITRNNLQTAYNREMRSKAIYDASAVRADADGYPGVAGVFRAVAFSESIHAANHAKALGVLGGRPLDSWERPLVPDTTKESLEAAVKAALTESAKTYPVFVAQALKEGTAQAIMSLKGAMASENAHARLFSKILARADGWKAGIKIRVCKTCGYTTDDPAIKICPFCMHPQKEFAQM